jgi:hypothetical protein
LNPLRQAQWMQKSGEDIFLLIDPEDAVNITLRNVDNFTPIYTA